MIGTVYNCTLERLQDFLVGRHLPHIGRVNIDQDNGSEQPPSSCVLSGCSVVGVVTQLARMLLDQDLKSGESPSSSVLSGWLVLGCASRPE